MAETVFYFTTITVENHRATISGVPSSEILESI